MLYQKERHVELKNIEWSEEQVSEAIHRLYIETIEALNPETFWPTHPDEDGNNPSNKSIYFGAAGTLLGLNETAQYLNAPLPFDTTLLVENILASYFKNPDTHSIVPSYFLGTTGIFLIHYKLTQSKEVAEKLLTDIDENIDNPVNEALWGCPGTMLAALQMYEWTSETRWKDLFLSNVDYLWSEWKPNGPDNSWVWTQNLYGSKRKIVGAGHGFFGNIFPLLKGAHLLEVPKAQQLFSRIAHTLETSAQVENNLANWPAIFESKEPRYMVQWCHGAPGVITSMTDFPKGISEKVETLLLQAGNTIWKAGPLTKKTSICHGTDGNGFAFLKLYNRTKDPLWLKRARSFAMHAISEETDRFTLWTGGKIGLASYLTACLKGTDSILSLDSNGELYHAESSKDLLSDKK